MRAMLARNGGEFKMSKGISETAYSEDVLALNPELATTLITQPASKYKNVRAESKGLRFQSGHEAAEISKLILLDEKHLIYGLRLQVKFPLQGGNSWTADAVYLDSKLQVHVVDVKPDNYQTKEFRIKAKLFKEKYNKEIELV